MTDTLATFAHYTSCGCGEEVVVIARRESLKVKKGRAQGACESRDGGCAWHQCSERRSEREEERCQRIMVVVSVVEVNGIGISQLHGTLLS